MDPFMGSKFDHEGFDAVGKNHSHDVKKLLRE